MIPFEISRLLYVKNRKVFGYAMVFSPEAFYEKGILYSLTKMLYENNIVILYLSFANSSPKKDNGLLLFLDISDSTLQKDEIKRKIESLKYVKKVELIEPLNDIIVDSFFFPPTVLNDRIIVFRKPFFESFIAEIQKRMGTGGSAILFHIGYYIGYKVFDSHLNIVGKDREKLRRFGYVIFKNVGYGIIKEYKYIDRKYAILHIYRNFECEINRELSKKDYQSHFVRGLLTGWFERYFEKKVAVTETKCIAKGDSFCEFHISVEE